MNNFYYSFFPAFNYWYILMPVDLIIMGLFGAYNCKSINMRTNEPRKRFKDCFVDGIAVIMDAVLVILVVKESARGIIQAIDNTLTKTDDPMWSLGIFVIIMITLAVVSYYLLMLSYAVGETVKVSYLERRRGRKK